MAMDEMKRLKKKKLYLTSKLIFHGDRAITHGQFLTFYFVNCLRINFFLCLGEGICSENISKFLDVVFVLLFCFSIVTFSQAFDVNIVCHLHHRHRWSFI